MIGRLHHVILDCPDPAVLAGFYAELLGQPITYQSADFAVVAGNDTTSGLAFQLVPGHRPSTWPDPEVPQQIHLDIMVEDPFCLIKRPAWAPPITELLVNDRRPVIR